MNKSIYIALYALAATFVGHASDVWNWDDQFYQARIRPQVKDIRKARQSYEQALKSYEHLLRTAERVGNMQPNPFFVLERLKNLPAEIKRDRALEAKGKLTEQDRHFLLHKGFNYAKFFNMMNNLGSLNFHGEIGAYHPEVSKFIRSYINNPELIDIPMTFERDYPVIEDIMKNLSIKPLDNYQGAIRERIQEQSQKIQEHKLSSLFNRFTKRVYNQSRNR
jgi:hypothetical protein